MSISAKSKSMEYDHRCNASHHVYTMRDFLKMLWVDAPSVMTKVINLAWPPSMSKEKCYAVRIPSLLPRTTLTDIHRSIPSA